MAGDDVRVVLVYCLFFLVSVSDHVGKVSPAQTDFFLQDGRQAAKTMCCHEKRSMDGFLESSHKLDGEPIQAA